MTTQELEGETFLDTTSDSLTAMVPFEESDDPNKRTHVVHSGQNPHIGTPDWSAQDIVDAARLSGQEVTALCGYKWTPKHNPDNHEACKMCLDLWSKMGA